MKLVPDVHPVGERVVMFPNIAGTVVAIDGNRREVQADGGVIHNVSVMALVKGV